MPLGQANAFGARAGRRIAPIIMEMVAFSSAASITVLPTYCGLAYCVNPGKLTIPPSRFARGRRRRPHRWVSQLTMLLMKPGVSGRSLPPAFTVRLMSWLGRDGLTVSRTKAAVSAPPASVMVTTNAGCSALRGLLQLGGGLARSPASGGTAVVPAGVAIPIAVVCRGRVPAVVPDQPARKLAVYILVRACCQIGDLAVR